MKKNARLSVLADSASVDQTGKLSVIGIFNKVFGEQIPLKFPVFYYVVTLVGDPGEPVSLEPLYVDPAGNEKKLGKLEITISDTGEANLISRLEYWVFSAVGRHSFFLVDSQGRKYFESWVDVFQTKKAD